MFKSRSGSEVSSVLALACLSRVMAFCGSTCSSPLLRRPKRTSHSPVAWRMSSSPSVLSPLVGGLLVVVLADAGSLPLGRSRRPPSSPHSAQHVVGSKRLVSLVTLSLTRASRPPPPLLLQSSRERSRSRPSSLRVSSSVSTLVPGVFPGVAVHERRDVPMRVLASPLIVSSFSLLWSCSPS